MPPIATLTKQQILARDTRKVSVALEAGAGCGKTYVLTERFLSHLDPDDPEAPQPQSVQHLIAITFTDAAAREMRTRIRQKCSQRLDEAATEAHERYWLSLQRAIETARISTIHAFCTSLLRAHAVDAGLDPAFGVLDQGDADVLQSDVIDDVLRERLAERDEDVLNLAATFGLGRLKEQLRLMMNCRDDQAFEKWLEAERQEPQDLVDTWRARYAQDAVPAAARAIAVRAPIKEILDLLKRNDSTKDSLVEAKDVLLELLPRLRDGKLSDADDLQAIRDHAGVSGICNKNDWTTQEEYDRYRDACKALRDLIDSHNPQPFDESVAREAAERGLALLRLADVAATAYQGHKSRQNQLDFDDLLALAHQLLTGPQGETVRKRFVSDLKLLLVDEFQDTDQLQGELIRILCGDGFDVGKLFFVGDQKQSIYRFRGAQPQVFREMQTEIPPAGHLPLTINFRSQPAILNFVNALFCKAFDEEYKPLVPSRPQTTPERAVEFLWALPPQPGTRLNAEEARRQEARWIARRLQKLMEDKEKIIVDRETGEPRPLKPGDVALLFRALSNVQLYEDALRECGLEYYVVGGHAFYSQQEIYDVLNLLRSVASAADEISLAGVLRSPMFSLADESLFLLHQSAGSLNAGLFGEPLPAELSAAELAKTAFAAETIRHLRQLKDEISVAELIGEALARTGYDAALLAEFLGERKLANLHKLVERARATDEGGGVPLDGFITQLAQFIASQPKEALAATCPESANVVRLMTIHQAKGLEFPLVVVPDLNRRPNQAAPDAALDPQLGPLVPLPSGADKATIGMTLYMAAENQAEEEERRRLLYVATTRAADYLILSASLASYDKLQNDWLRLLAERFDLASGALNGRLPVEYPLPSIHVTDKEPAFEHKPTGKSRRKNLPVLLDEAKQLAAERGGSVPEEVKPVAVDYAARVQYSFSRLTGKMVRREPAEPSLADEPAAAAGPAVDPLGLGSLVHTVLERANPAADCPLGQWCEQLAAEHVVENAAATAAEARDMVERFAQSPRWAELARARHVRREIEFLLAWPPGSANGNGCYLEGFIDCLYQDPKSDWHLVDYKTNDVPADGCAAVARQYEMQLYVYALAVERALGRAPVELVLCFLRPGVEHPFPWDDAARERAIEMVDQAMAASRQEASHV